MRGVRRALRLSPPLHLGGVGDGGHLRVVAVVDAVTRSPVLGGAAASHHVVDVVFGIVHSNVVGVRCGGVLEVLVVVGGRLRRGGCRRNKRVKTTELRQLLSQVISCIDI